MRRRTISPRRGSRGEGARTSEPRPSKWLSPPRLVCHTSRGRERPTVAMQGNRESRPVSISALARMAPLEALADRFSRGLRPPRVAACDGPHAFRRRFVKVALFFIFPNRRGALFQPVAGGQIQHCRKRRLADPRLAFQVRFQLAGYASTVHLGVHALHCSEWRPCVGSFGVTHFRRMHQSLDARTPNQRRDREGALPYGRGSD